MENYHFSRRERESLELLLQGLSNKQIAAKLGVTEHTIEFHLKNIYAKLGVRSRAEAIVKLGKTPGATFGEKLGESTVDLNKKNSDNHHRPVKFLKRYGLFIIVALLPLVILIYLISRPAAYVDVERECENPYFSSVGQTLSRTNASGGKVHGQFGTTGEAPWDAKAGQVIYQNLNIPQTLSLFLKIRYSKNSPASVPILIYLDSEPNPRASFYPKDQHDWNQFTWSEPIYLGKVKGGKHSLSLSTLGQQYGVADLDQFILTSKIP